MLFQIMEANLPCAEAYINNYLKGLYIILVIDLIRGLRFLFLLYYSPDVMKRRTIKEF